MGRRFDVVVCDLDGTLVDTAALHIASSHHAVESVLGREVTDETVHLSLGRPLPESVAVLARGAGIASDAEVARVTPPLITAFLDYYAAHQASFVRLFPGVAQTLATLRDRGYQLAVLSNKLRDWGRIEMDALGLAAQFAVSVFADDMPEAKPSGRALDPVLAALDVLPGRVLLVGDGAADMLCARAAGARSAAALWGALAPGPLRDLAPDYLLDAPQDLLAVCPDDRDA